MSYRLISASIAASLLAGCAGPFPPRDPPGPLELVEQRAEQWAQRPAIRTIRVPGRFFVVEPVSDPIPAEIAEREIEFAAAPPPVVATLDDVLTIMEQVYGVPVGITYEETDSATLLALPLTFRSYRGSLGGLLRKLENTLNIAFRYRDGSLLVSSIGLYSVTVPQNPEIVGVVAGEIGELGGTVVMDSELGGQILYTAPPARNRDVLAPYLRRLAHNLAEVTIQVALVSVAIGDTNNRGFDWDSFSVLFDAENMTEEFSFGSISASTIRGSLIRDNVNIFGTQTAVTVAGAINFLSTFGRTVTDQDVQVRTISGNPVTIRSGQEVPFVEQITTNATGDNVSSGVEFGSVTTGITVELTPSFDAGTGIVTTTISIENQDIVRFLDVPAGNNLGTVQRPITQDQSLTDLVRVPAGETVILGGITRTTDTDNRSTPWGLWDIADSNSDVQRSALFIVLRPFVTVYDLDDNPVTGDLRRAERFESTTDLRRPVPDPAEGRIFMAPDPPADISPLDAPADGQSDEPSTGFFSRAVGATPTTAVPMDPPAASSGPRLDYGTTEAQPAPAPPPRPDGERRRRGFDAAGNGLGL